MIQRDLKPVAFVEDNPYMTNDTFAGVDIVGNDDLCHLDWDISLIGSASIVVNDTIEKALSDRNMGKPIVRLAEFDRLADYI